jgi:hypothetical protein
MRRDQFEDRDDDRNDGGRHEVVVNATCAEQGCGQPFTITAGERDFFQNNGMTLPRRCKPCRERRRAAKEGGR